MEADLSNKKSALLGICYYSTLLKAKEFCLILISVSSVPRCVVELLLPSFNHSWTQLVTIRWFGNAFVDRLCQNSLSVDLRSDIICPSTRYVESSVRKLERNYRVSDLEKLLKSMLKGRDQWEWIGLWKVAIDWHLLRIVVIYVHFYFNLAAMLE